MLAAATTTACPPPVTRRPVSSSVVPTLVRMNLTVEFWLQKDEFGRRDLVMGKCQVQPDGDHVQILTQ